MPTLGFSFAVEDCLDCCIPPCLEDGTMLDLLIPSITTCNGGCATGGLGGHYSFVTPNDILGTWTAEAGNSVTITTLMAQIYFASDCTDPIGDPVSVNIEASVDCLDGKYRVTIGYMDPTDAGTFVLLFDSVRDFLDTSLPSTVDCSTAPTDNRAFVVDSVELSEP